MATALVSSMLKSGYLNSVPFDFAGKLCDGPAICDILRHKYDFPYELASRVASELTCLRNPKRADSILSFFKESGFSNTQLVKIVRFRPRILVGSLEDSIKPKIKIFQDLGFTSHDVCKMISNNPAVLDLSMNDNIIPSLSVMKGLLGSDNAVIRVLRKSPRFLNYNLENTVLANVEFLKSSGVSMERIRIILLGYPTTFSLQPEVMRKAAERAKEMGLSTSSKMFIYAIPVIASVSNEAWELKLQAFRNLGFSDSDLLTMFRKAPIAFAGSAEKAKEVKELLLATGKFNISSIVDNPLSLMFSIEKRYKPRLQVLQILENRKLINGWPSLQMICNLSEDEFFKKFISPYLDQVSDVYVTKKSARGK